MGTHRWDQDGLAIWSCSGPVCTHFCSSHHTTAFPDGCSAVVLLRGPGPSLGKGPREAGPAEDLASLLVLSRGTKERERDHREVFAPSSSQEGAAVPWRHISCPWPAPPTHPVQIYPHPD